MVESADNVSDTPAPVWLRRQLEIVNAYGLHMRPSTRFVTLARSFRAEVFVVVEDRRANGKSILDMTSLAATPARRSSSRRAGTTRNPLWKRSPCSSAPGSTWPRKKPEHLKAFPRTRPDRGRRRLGRGVRLGRSLRLR